MSGKADCEVKAEVACNNQVVRRYTGRKKGDPKFMCCIGCLAYLRRQGVKLKEAPAKEYKRGT